MNYTETGPPSQNPAGWCRHIATLLPPGRGNRQPYRRDHPALAMRCPWCRARPDAWCYRLVRDAAQPVIGFMHPSRVASVGMQFVPVMPPRDEDATRNPRSVP